MSRENVEIVREAMEAFNRRDRGALARASREAGAVVDVSASAPRVYDEIPHQAGVSRCAQGDSNSHPE